MIKIILEDFLSQLKINFPVDIFLSAVELKIGGHTMRSNLQLKQSIKWNIDTFFARLASSAAACGPVCSTKE